MYSPISEKHQSRIIQTVVDHNNKVGWKWGKQEVETAIQTIHTIDTPTSTTREAKKPIFTRDLSSILNWHFWTIIPCITTAVLLSLNFAEYVIGTELGKTAQGTENILGILQLAAKAHEVTIVVGLANITQQWIQGCLIGGGTLLGLLCAEQSLGKPSFIISNEFLAAIGYSLNGIFRPDNKDPKERRRRRNVLLLVVFIYFGCLLCAAVGPASAVLMIPQLNWFYESQRVYDVATELKSERNVTSRYPVCYPYILIDPRLGGGQYLSSPFNSAPEPQYWSHAWFLKVLHDQQHTDEMHQFSEDGTPTTVNTTTSWGRPLITGANWEGGTSLSTVNLWDVITTSTTLEGYQPATKNIGSKAQFIADLTGIQATTVCRRRLKQPCITGDTSDWCYLSVSKDNDGGTLQSSDNLLLIVDHMPDKDMKVLRPRFWMTEGSRTTTNPRFADSVVFVFEESLRPGLSEPLLTVCSISATLKSVTASSSAQRFSAEQAQFHEHLAYYDGTSTKYVPPRTIIYHENWLDQVHSDVPDASNSSTPISPMNVTYPPRSDRQPTVNRYLNAWAIEVMNSNTHTGAPIWEPVPGGDIEAGILETVIGGAYITILSRMQASDSQYSTSYIPRRFIRSGAVETYPQDLLPEEMLDYTSYRYPAIRIYRLVYGYRSLSVVGVLSVAVLIFHSIIAVLGSLWQFKKGGVIRAWNSVPQFTTLCLGTSPVLGGIENTCAGIDKTETLNTFVRIGETRRDHLELAVMEGWEAGDLERVDKRRMYGHLGPSGRKLKVE